MTQRIGVFVVLLSILALSAAFGKVEKKPEEVGMLEEEIAETERLLQLQRQKLRLIKEQG